MPDYKNGFYVAFDWEAGSNLSSIHPGIIIWAAMYKDSWEKINVKFLEYQLIIYMLQTKKEIRQTGYALGKTRLS